jgi:flagellar hook-associated protein 3 FlgL
MRISTNQIYQNGVNGILDQQAQLSKTQIQMSTGKKVVTPSDNPAGAAQILQLQHSIDLTNTYQSNITSANQTLGSEENALSSGTTLLQNIRDLAVQANSGALTDQDRQAIAQQIQQDLASLVGVANSQDGNGNYIFAGNRTNTLPFVRTAGGISYGGDQGQSMVQIGANRQIASSDSGYAAFQAIRNGNGTFTTTYGSANTGTGVIDAGQVTNQAAWVPDTYTLTFLTPTTYEVRNSASNLVSSGTYQSGAAIAFNGVQVTVSGAPAAGDTFTVAPSTNQDVFTTVQKLVNALTAPVLGGAAGQANLSSDIGSALVNIDQALQNFSNVRTGVGARLSTATNQQSANSDIITASQTALSAVQDLDYTKGASLLNQQMLGLQAAQQTFVKMQNLSLFNYIQ